MLLTLAILVFFASIIVFFSQEFIRMFKRIFAIWGAKTIIPLAVASWAVFTFDYWFLWAIYYYKELLQRSCDFLTELMPFQQGAALVAAIILLTVISVAPVYFLDLFLRKRTYKHYKYPYVTSTMIWLISSELLLIMTTPA